MKMGEYYLIIKLIHFKFGRSMYMICSNRTWGKYEYGTILQLIILYSDYQVQSNLQYRGNNTIHVIVI